MNELLKNLGKNIFRARKNSKIKQKDLALESGISQETLSQIEAGEIDVGISVLESISKALGISKEELLFSDEMPKKFFTPHVLKTIEVNVERKIFRINGEDFGKGCTGFSIECRSYKDFDIRVEVDTTVTFASYGENQKKTLEKVYKTNDPWFNQEPSLG